ncbi:MAG TPA: polysaccharide lyase family protein, partial [Pyrinomonadaceae bacterium]
MTRRSLQALVLTLALAACAAAQERPLWQIGEFNGSSDEFGTQAPAAFEPASSGVKSWGATQQAVAHAAAAPPAGRAIRFALGAEPRGVYRLKLGLLITTPRLPVVQVEVNGRRGWFHQRPERDFEEGNLEAYTFPQYAIGSLVAEIPAEFLRRGPNEISLTALADPHTAALPGGTETGDAMLRYDALALYTA